MKQEQDHYFAYLVTLIEQLPEDFVAAREQIHKIIPQLALCSADKLERCCHLIAQQTNAPSIEAVLKVIAQGVNKQRDEFLQAFSRSEWPMNEMTLKIVESLTLFREMIDTVQAIGAVGERRNVGIILMVIASRLLPKEPGSSDALALKNVGHLGVGKSYTLACCLRIQPETAYHMIIGGSAKSLYYLEDGLQHKVLILTEAEALASPNGRDNELATAVRSLLSEGELKYQRTEKVGNHRETVTTTVPGPTALITTTVREKLEGQLDDRMIGIKPNTSAEQTARIIEQSAAAAAGTASQIDTQLIEAWRRFHDLLEPYPVIIPFAAEIGRIVKRSGELPIQSHRSFTRVLSAIKTVALMHQFQRTFDEQGRLIAKMADYAIAYQLLAPSFTESLGGNHRHTHERVRFIADNGPTTPRAIAQQFNIARPTVFKWMAPLIEDGILVWCDADGVTYDRDRDLKKAKRSGTACVRVANRIALPSPFELTGDPQWAEGGSLFTRYDLHLDNDDYDINQDFGNGVSLFAEMEGIGV